MRIASLPIVLMLLAISMAGCFGTDDTPNEPTDPVCTDEDKLNETNEECYEEPEVPNVPPMAALSIMDDDGNTMDATTYVMKGANMTFSAAASNDTDGSIVLAGLSVTDANGTRIVSLMDNGTYVDVTLDFMFAGPVNVTLSVLDNAGAGATATAMTAVNEAVPATLSFESAAPPGGADACEAPGASSGAPGLVTDNYAQKESFTVAADAHWISAKITSGSGEIAICAPGSPGDALSDAGTDVETADEDNSTLPVNALYYIMVLHKGNGPGDVTVETIVHFEMKPDA